MSKKNKIMLSVIITSIIMISTITTLAFFTINPKQEQAQAHLKTAKVSAVFEDADAGVVGGAIKVGESVTKYFTIENTGTVNTTVKMYWHRLINTYTVGSLTFTLSYSETKDGEYIDLVTEENVPLSSEPSKKMLADDIFLPVGAKYYYKLAITFNHLEHIDQNKDIDAMFSTTFSLEDAPNTTKMMMARVDDEKIWAHTDEIKKIVFEPVRKEKENAVHTYNLSLDQETESVMAYLVPDTEDPTKYIAYIQSQREILANTNCSNLFSEFNNLESIEGLEYFDTSKVTNMYQMFSKCQKLTNLDVSHFDTSKVTHMGIMFGSSSSITSLDLSNFDTSKVINMGLMFVNCSSLKTVNLSNFDTSRVTRINGMFSNCSSLVELDLSNFDTGEVTNLQGIFYRCRNLVSLNINKFNTSKVTDMGDMFSGCNSLKTLDLSNFDTSKVTSMANMFANCTSLTELNISHFNTSKVTDIRAMFNTCSNLTSLDLSNFDTSNVSDLSYMFNGCKNLISLDVSNFNTSKVTNMANMFTNCSNLKSLDVSSFDTGSVYDMSGMFSNCIGLSELNISGFDTSNVINMEYVFRFLNIKVIVDNDTLKQWVLDNSSISDSNVVVI